MEFNKRFSACLWAVIIVLLGMSSAPVDYQALYEKTLLEKEAVLVVAEQTRQVAQHIAQQKQQQAEAQIQELTEKLTLSLFKLDRLRRKLFGRSLNLRCTILSAGPTTCLCIDRSRSLKELTFN